MTHGATFGRHSIVVSIEPLTQWDFKRCLIGNGPAAGAQSYAHPLQRSR